MTDLEDRLRAHVRALAGDIGERNLFKPRKLAEAAEYIRSAWRQVGFEVGRQAYAVDGIACENLWAEVRGMKKPEEMILVGAHYDSVSGCPGADDNASGVAALLEISQALRQAPPAYSVRFAAFVNEEPPFFDTRFRGSLVYAEEASRRHDKIRWMMSLETIGYYTSEPKSQQYPAFLGLLYPPSGNFISMVGDLPSRKLVSSLKKIFKQVSDFPLETVSAPRVVPGVDWSDQASFWDKGWRGVMVTDTALYRNPHYHGPDDTPETLDYASFARVTAGLARTLERAAR